jgi:hypothetical protein
MKLIVIYKTKFCLSKVLSSRPTEILQSAISESATRTHGITVIELTHMT